MIKQPTIREIESRFPFVAIPAGLKNLAKSTQIAYKEHHKKRVQAVRDFIRSNGDWPSETFVRAI